MQSAYMVNAVRLKTVFTVVSASLSGLFGYLLAEGVMGLNILLAALFASFAFGLAWAVAFRAYSEQTGDRLMVRVMTVVIVPLLVLNTIADYSSAAAVRNIVATKIGDVNRVSSDKIGEIKRIEGRQSAILARPVMSAFLESPDAYKARIQNLEGDATIMKRSGNCQNQTRDDTRDHCKRLQDAKEGLGQAEERIKLNAELKKLDEALVAAKAATAGITTHANASEAATRAFVSWALLTRNLSEDNTSWGTNAVMLLTTIALMVVICGFSHYIGTVHGRDHMASNGTADFTFTAPALPGPAEARAPIPLKPVTDNLVVIDGREQPDSSNTDALIARALAVMELYENSPYARKAGAA